MNKFIAVGMLVGFSLVSLESYAGFIQCSGKIFSSTSRAAVTRTAVLEACGKPAQSSPTTLIYEDKGKIVKFVDGILTDVILIKG